MSSFDYCQEHAGVKIEWTNIHDTCPLCAQAKEIGRLKKIESSLEAWLEAAQSVDPKGGILVTALKRTLKEE